MQELDEPDELNPKFLDSTDQLSEEIQKLLDEVFNKLPAESIYFPITLSATKNLTRSTNPFFKLIQLVSCKSCYFAIFIVRKIF